MKDFKKLIADAVEARTALHKKIAPLNDRIRKLNIRIADLKEEEALAFDATLLSREDQIKHFLFEDGSVAGERYSQRRAFWAKSFLSMNGYIPEVNQIQLRIMLYKNDEKNFNGTIDNLREVLPLIASVEGIKRVNIFEHNLSENGRYNLVTDDVKYWVERVYGYRTNTVFESVELYDVMKFIKEDLWYEVV